MTSQPQLYDWMILAAVALGPIIGIWVTRVVDSHKEKARKREAVFEGLIKTRGLELSYEHANAFNMVPFLFKEPRVRAAYSKTMEALNDTSLSSSDDNVYNAAIVRMNAARADLIREVGEAVGTPLPTSEMERFGYAPMAWRREHSEQETLRTHLIEALEGRRALHTIATVFEPPENSGEPAKLTDPFRLGASSNTTESTPDKDRG